MQGTMHILDRSGDTAIAFDTEDQTSVDHTKEEFDRIVSQGYLAFGTLDDGTNVQLKLAAVRRGLKEGKRGRC